MPRDRVDKVLVERGLAPSRERARAMILAGLVEAGGRVVDKAGAMVEPGEVTLRAPDHPYVSRGALKLAHGLDRFGIDPTGKVALDVGYGQLAWSLRQDPRVVVLERENIRNLDPARVPEAAGLAVADVSFISLTLVLPKIASLLAPGSPIVALVKPQFEVGKGEVGRGGVVRDAAKRLAALEKVKAAAVADGLRVHAETESPILGPAGNVEYLVHLET